MVSQNVKGQIEKYKVVGDIYVWKYRENQRNYPGWNFTMDKNASFSMVELLNLMDSCEWSSKKLILLSKPTQMQLDVPNNMKGKAKFKGYEELILNFRKTEDENYWVITELKDCIEIKFGKNRLSELKNAIMGIPLGKGDFGISDENEDNILNIWWNLKG